MKEIWLIRKCNGYTSQLTWCHFYGSEEELMEWLEANQIAIISSEPKQDGFGMNYILSQLSIPCKGKDYERADKIKKEISDALTNLGCSANNISGLLHSFNFDKEFINYECEDRDITIDYIYVAVSKYNRGIPNDERFLLKNLLDNFWEILNRECQIYKR